MQEIELSVENLLRGLEGNYPRGLKSELLEVCRGPLHRQLAQYLRLASESPIINDNLSKGVIAAQALLALNEAGLGDSFSLPSEEYKKAAEYRDKLKKGEAVSDAEIESINSTNRRPSSSDDTKFLVDRTLKILEKLGEAAELPQIRLRVNCLAKVLNKKGKEQNETTGHAEHVESYFQIGEFEGRDILVITKPISEINKPLNELILEARLTHQDITAVVLGGLTLADRAAIGNARELEVDGKKMYLIELQEQPVTNTHSLITDFTQGL